MRGCGESGEYPPQRKHTSAQQKKTNTHSNMYSAELLRINDKIPFMRIKRCINFYQIFTWESAKQPSQICEFFFIKCKKTIDGDPVYHRSIQLSPCNIHCM